MESVANEDRQRRLEALAVWCIAELKGIEPDASMLEKLGFGSVETMRIQLGNWNVPDWAAQAPNPAPSERKARGSGPEEELPPATAAAPLFEDAIEALSNAVENLEHRREYIQGGRFVVGVVYDGPVYFPRSSFFDTDWQTLCESNNVDPDARGFWDDEGGLKNALGAAKTPAAPLSLLISVYALWRGSVGELVRALHLKPEKVNWVRIGRLLHGTKTKHGADGLLRIAEQLATEVRGLRTGRGAPPPPVTAREHNLACQVTFYRERGLSDEEIY